MDTRLNATENASAQTLAGRAILLEIGAKLGVLAYLVEGEYTPVVDIAKRVGVTPELVSSYYAALSKAGLAVPMNADATSYGPSSILQKSINDAGYILWGTISCAPLLSNVGAFARDMAGAAEAFPRDGEHVARTSRWMGEQDFYPQAEAAIIATRPRKIVDLGAGTCGLLVRCLRQLPAARGVGIDLSRSACDKAREIVAGAGLASRLEIVQSPIQALVDDPTPILGADVIHGGFVFHDLMPDEEETLDALLRTFRTRAPGTLIIVDAVPYGQESGEEAFSAAFTFLHHHFMSRRLQNESEWTTRLTAAGYERVDVTRLGISGGRIFTARAVL